MLHIASSIVVLIVATGLYFRHRPAWHIRLMTAAFCVDLALVLYIELTRHAVEKVATTVRPMLWIHAAISLAVLANYLVMIWLGRRVLKGNRASRSTHRNMGITFIVLRGLNYATALIM
jgi:hypothetical protein